MWKKILIPIAVIVVLAVGGLTVVKSRLGTDSATHEGAAELAVGATLPDFQMEKFGGGTNKASELKSKVILINFWATWCEACVVEMPSIVKLRNHYKDKGFEVILFNVDDNPEAVLPRFLKQFAIDFPVYIDADGKLGQLFDVHAIPLTVIMDGSRKILFIENGERDWFGQEIRSRLDGWLKQ